METISPQTFCYTKVKVGPKTIRPPRRFGPTRFLDLSGREVGKQTFRLLDRFGGIWKGREEDAKGRDAKGAEGRECKGRIGVRGYVGRGGDAREV